MRSLAVLLTVLVTSACSPKTCDPKPVPEGYADYRGLLPPSAVVCGENPNNGRGMWVNFPERDVTKLSRETAALLTSGGWTIDNPSQTDKGHIFARKGDKALNIDLTEHKGGPNAGRVTGSVLDSSR